MRLRLNEHRPVFLLHLWLNELRQCNFLSNKGLFSCFLRFLRQKCLILLQLVCRWKNYAWGVHFSVKRRCKCPHLDWLAQALWLLGCRGLLLFLNFVEFLLCAYLNLICRCTYRLLNFVFFWNWRCLISFLPDKFCFWWFLRQFNFWFFVNKLLTRLLGQRVHFSEFSTCNRLVKFSYCVFVSCSCSRPLSYCSITLHSTKFNT